MQSLGRTKIVCTLGPASSDPGVLAHLVDAGMDIARLNFSHGTHDDHQEMLRRVREVSERHGKAISVLQDLQGPKIRIGDLSTPSVDLVAGAAITITTAPTPGDAARISTDFQGLPGDVHPGEAILIDDGKIRLRVSEVRGTDVKCQVVVGGTLTPHKGVNLPGVSVNTPSLTPKDRDDLAWGITHAVDMIALSFVREAGDILELRRLIRSLTSDKTAPTIIAKIEKPQAVTNLDAIIAEADGVMIARGDLGVELPAEEVPLLQKRITRKCNAAGKPVIIATQMLESMIHSPVPTRAEASDVANAVVDGADAVMLSGETSVGKYPVESVAIMERIILRAESEYAGRRAQFGASPASVKNRHDALGWAACLLAEQMRAAAIVTITNSGQTAKVLARYRPDIPIVAITDSGWTLRQLNIVWGIRGMLVENLSVDSDKALQAVQEMLLARKVVRKGEYIVLLAGQPIFARGSTNFIKVERIG